jgi:hypothetical protein
MPDTPRPKPAGAPPATDPAVYGGQWGGGGNKPDDPTTPALDRPDRIETPNEKDRGKPSRSW